MNLVHRLAYEMLKATFPPEHGHAGVPEKLRCAGDGLLFCSDEAQDTHTEAAPRSPTHILKGGYYKFEDKDSAERKPATLEMEGVLYCLGAGSWVWVFVLFFVAGLWDVVYIGRYASVLSVRPGLP